MKNTVFLVFTFLAFVTSIAQNDSIWTAFWGEDFSLKGYVDADGDTVIKPKFIGSTTANKFKNIIAVVEQKSDGFEYYYLTKSGKIIGRDSLYFFDNTSDCESEGYIRFRDKNSGLVGMFNKNGKVVVPAKYQELSKVLNGFIVAKKEAQKVHCHEHGVDGCNQFHWEGGKTQLINTKNELLIEDFDYPYPLNLYNLKISNQPFTDTICFNFQAVDGSYYQFENFENSFLEWLQNDFLNNPNMESFATNAMDSITYWKNGWQKEAKKEFISSNYAKIIEVLKQLSSSKSDYHISISGVNASVFGAKIIEGYLNYCGEPNYRKYPMMEIIITHNTVSGKIQDSFGFLKTKDGFKLITLSARSFSLK
jgi:hypothetical protein